MNLSPKYLSVYYAFLHDFIHHIVHLMYFRYMKYIYMGGYKFAFNLTFYINHQSNSIK